MERVRVSVWSWLQSSHQAFFLFLVVCGCCVSCGCTCSCTFGRRRVIFLQLDLGSDGRFESGALVEIGQTQRRRRLGVPLADSNLRDAGARKHKCCASAGLRSNIGWFWRCWPTRGRFEWCWANSANIGTLASEFGHLRLDFERFRAGLIVFGPIRRLKAPASASHLTVECPEPPAVVDLVPARPHVLDQDAVASGGMRRDAGALQSVRDQAPCLAPTDVVPAVSVGRPRQGGWRYTRARTTVFVVGAVRSGAWATSPALTALELPLVERCPVPVAALARRPAKADEQPLDDISKDHFVVSWPFSEWMWAMVGRVGALR